MFIFLSFNCLPSLTEYLHQESVLALETVPVLVTDCRCNCKRWTFLLQYAGKKNMLPLENSSTTYQTRCKAGHVWCQKKLGQRLEGLGQGEHSVTLTYVRWNHLVWTTLLTLRFPEAFGGENASIVLALTTAIGLLLDFFWLREYQITGPGI